MCEFYPDFKSACPQIRNSSDIDSIMGTIIRNQHLLDCHTTPHEMKKWDKQELDSFKIEYSQIDRLYFIWREDNFWDNGEHYKLIVRIKYIDETYIYVYLTGGYFEAEKSCIYGLLFISREAKYFMSLVLEECYKFLDNKDMYELLKYDSIHIKVYIDNDIFNITRRTDLKLEYLCYENIYKNIDKLQSKLIYLPKIIFENIDTSIKFKKAQDAYMKLKVTNYYYL